MIRLAILLLLGTALAAAEDPRSALDILARDDPRDRAIAAGLAHLRSRQGADGRIGDQCPVAVTGLAVLAHLATGITPDDPHHGQTLVRAIRFILSAQDKNGYLGGREGSRMYGHGIATLMLTQAMGMTRDDRLEEEITVAVRKAIGVTIAAAQVPKPDNHRGGWHYEPGATDADLSLSGWQLISCHAAQQVGIDVPRSVIDAALAYVRRLTRNDGKVGYNDPNQDNPALRGLALLAFAIAGQDDDPICHAVAERIAGTAPQWQGAWFFYQSYYEASGLSRAAPAQWERHGPRLEQLLVQHQNPDGSWPIPPGSNEGNYAPYGTAMAVLALAVERHILPAYGR